MSKIHANETESTHPRFDLKNLTDQELLTLFVERKIESAFEELVGRHCQLVLNVSRAVVWDHGCVEDAFQATFLAVVRNAKRLRNVESFSAWLCRVARNAAIKAAKRNKCFESQINQVEPSIEVDPLNQIAAREVVQSLSEELEKIPHRYREALTLFYFEQLSRIQIAQRMNSTENAVKSLLQRGKQLLRKRMMRKGVVPSLVVLGVCSVSSVGNASESTLLVSKTVAACTGKAALPKTGLALSQLGTCSASALSSIPAKAMITACFFLATALTSILLSSTNNGNQSSMEVVSKANPNAADSNLFFGSSIKVPTTPELERTSFQKQSEDKSPLLSRTEPPVAPSYDAPISTIRSSIVSGPNAKELRTDHRIDTNISSGFDEQ